MEFNFQALHVCMMWSWIQWTLQLDSIRVMRGKKELNPAVVPLTSILNSTDIQEVSWIQLYIMRTCNALKLNAMVYNWLVSGIQYTSQLNYYFHLFAVTSSFIMIFQIFKSQNVWFDPTNHMSKGYYSNRSNKGIMANLIFWSSIELVQHFINCKIK